MPKQRLDPERDLRAWADALNAVADLQAAIVAEARQMTMLDDWEWLNPYRAIVSATLKTFPDRAKDQDMRASAEGLKHTATQALAGLREEAQTHARSHET